ncbi:hypothetical protein C8R44DRAFT_791919 [Mycena epipterygia]|nr:hypothetical protein C8R44DRAFT_791919 [Mycena epipterygia]
MAIHLIFLEPRHALYAGAASHSHTRGARRTWRAGNATGCGGKTIPDSRSARRSCLLAPTARCNARGQGQVNYTSVQAQVPNYG